MQESTGQRHLFYQGRYYPFSKEQIVIGSDPRCDIPIENNPHILPKHVWLTSLEGKVFLQCHDRNAVAWVNGVRVADLQQLQDQAEIAIGNPETKLTLRFNQTLTSSVGTTASQVSPNMGRMQAVSTPTTPPATLAGAPVGVTDTTRHLCAAGHLDESFQDYVMRHVVYENHKAMGESYGVNMHAVVSWCKSGVRRVNIRNAILLGFLLLICLIVLIDSVGSNTQSSPPGQSNGQSGSGYNPYGSPSGGGQSGSGYNPYGSPSGGSQSGSGYNPYGSLLPGGGIQSLGILGVLGILMLLIIVYLIERGIKRRWPRTHPGFVSLIVLLVLLLSSNTNPLLALLLVLALPLTIFIELYSRYYGGVTQRLGRGEFEKNLMPVPLDSDLTDKLNENFTWQRNVVAYSGFGPFAGAGGYLGEKSWSFVVDMTKGAQNELLQSERDEPQPFTLSELYATIEQALKGQGLNDVLEMEEKLYLNGEHLPENPPFFNAGLLRPVPGVDRRYVDYFKERPTEDVRYYQCIRFNFWRGEVIFTAFLRLVRRGKNLFVEVDYLVLPPLMEDYYWVDRKELVPPASKIWQLIKISFDSPIKLCFGLPGQLLRISRYQRQQRKMARVARNNPSFDYGAVTSVREFASDSRYHLFFQRLDQEMYLKIAEQELLETIVDFLDEHHIDTSGLLQRQQTIQDNSTFVGDVNVSGSSDIQVAVGSSAKNVKVSRPAAGGGRAKATAHS